MCWARAKEPHSVQLCVHTEQSCFGFLAGQGCDAFANLFVTPTLTLNLNTSAYRPHALQVLEACGGTVDTDKLRSANFAPRTSLRDFCSANFAPRTWHELRSANFAPCNSELRSANFAPRTSLRELCSANLAPRTSLRELRSASFAPRTSLRELRSANLATRTSLRELRSANFAKRSSRNFAPRTSLREFCSVQFRTSLRELRSASFSFHVYTSGACREPPRPQPCPIYLRAVFQCGRRWC